MNRLNQWRAEKQYKAKQNLLAHIHRDVAAELAAMRQADDFFQACVGRPKGPVHCECEPGSLTKYNVEYGQGVIPSSLARENSEFATLYRESMDKAREHTQTTSGGLNAQG
jgi:hypothetical protein